MTRALSIACFAPSRGNAVGSPPVGSGGTEYGFTSNMIASRSGASAGNPIASSLCVTSFGW